MNPLFIASLVSLALGFASGWAVRAQRADRDIAQIEARIDKERAAAALATRDAVQQARATEQARVTQLSEIANAAETKAIQARRDADAARTAAGRLRNAAATVAAAACPAPGNSTVAAASQAASSPAGMLAVVLGEIDERAGILAAYADAAAGAGNACQSAYGALK